MADLIASGSSDRDVDKALVALKKGTLLVKYGRKGKPKFCPFRLSSDESSLIWLTDGKEKALKLASVSRIISGQRTAVFQRFLRPEKDYLSFSLIYDNGKRSLDLICKDKVEAELWFAGLRALIASGQSGRSKIDGWSDGGIYFDDNRDLASNRVSGSSISTGLSSSPESSLKSSSLSKNYSFEKAVTFGRSDATNMQAKGTSSDIFRVSVSSAPSTSSHGSAHDDCDSLGDVYVWGEVICESAVKVSSDRYSTPFNGRTDILFPRPLDSNTILDVQLVACGVKHAALVTRHGEVFTWGEESGGCLGHGVGMDVIQPCLVESLSANTIELVACGDFHTCAVTASGELYTWGDGKFNMGLLGHGTNVSHWVPKRISGPLEGLQVAYVTCGTWHTALITSTGQLFTFGDGTFGVLGHGDRESVVHPREVESLMGLKTVSVACGVWHTAAVVEVIVTQSSSSISSGKLFTWGDGDKFRLGHGDKEPRLKPTCVPSLIDYNFHKLGCGHSLTVGLTTSGQVFTMGSTVYGQLGNPNSDGKLPSLVEDKLINESVVEVACGSYHVVVLTAKNEVYTWGKGANGRLGHGDIEDRKTPTIVEALRDRYVRHISCGSNFSSAICHHKWVSGAEQSQCSSCRQAFGFTRKRHNCYNCGLVHCHSCSSRKAMRAALSPNPSKLYRVCDSCYVKLIKVHESNGINNKKPNVPRLPGEIRDKLDKVDTKLTKSNVPSNLDMIKHLDSKAAKQGKKTEQLSLIRAPQGFASATHSVSTSRAVSPFSRRSSPPRSATPIPTAAVISMSKTFGDGLKKSNDILIQEIQKLQSQVEALKLRCEHQQIELQKATKRTQDALALAAEESVKSRAAKEVIKSLTAQLKDMAEKLPEDACNGDDGVVKVYIPNGTESAVSHIVSSNGETLLKSKNSGLDAPSTHSLANGLHYKSHSLRDLIETNQMATQLQAQKASSHEREVNAHIIHRNSNGGAVTSIGRTGSTDEQEPDNKHRSPSPVSNHRAAEDRIEQYEHGVYITLVTLPDGTRDLKRVRFSRRRFEEHQAELWWSMNREKVYEKYNVRPSDKASSAPTQSSRRSEEGLRPPHQAL